MKLKLNNLILLILTVTAAFHLGCVNDKVVPTKVAWNESTDGKLSGDLMAPTPVKFIVGNNKIIGSSTPNSKGYCTTFPGGPPAPIIPYFPGHEVYTDAFTFKVPAGKKLVAILVENLELEEFHKFADYPCVGAFKSQSGAFVAMNASSQIDWNSNTVQDFIALPTKYPLIGIGFTRTAGDNLLQKFRGVFPLPGYENVNNPNLTVEKGTYTFWWKEGQNKTKYTLNFVIE